MCYTDFNGVPFSEFRIAVVIHSALHSTFIELRNKIEVGISEDENL